MNANTDLKRGLDTIILPSLSNRMYFIPALEVPGVPEVSLYLISEKLGTFTGGDLVMNDSGGI